MGNILVTGGAGYIGSHVSKQLSDSGRSLVVLDDLSKGFRDAARFGELVVGETGDQALVSRVLKEYDIETVMHFAAWTVVPDSVAFPLKYYHNNTASTRNLVECCIDGGVKHFIFSSTAAVYGTPEGGVCAEDTPKDPINPYGQSKLMSELMLRDACNVNDMRYVVLRYFNVAGSDPSGRVGQSTINGTLLLKVAVEAAMGLRESMSIFGTDYPTPDGTGIRDYIHVEDLADAHLKALDYLGQGGASTTLNCGYGHGYSVREVLDMVGRVHGSPLTIKEGPRRAGDPAQLIARAERIREVLGWRPQYDDLETIVRTSLAWEQKLQELRRAGQWQPES